MENKFFVLSKKVNENMYNKYITNIFYFKNIIIF